MKLLVLSLGLLLLSGCTTIMSSSVTNTLPNNKGVVRAKAKDFTVLGFSRADLNVVLTDKLRQQCSTGKTNGVQTTLTVTNYLGWVQVYEVQAVGYCTHKTELSQLRQPKASVEQGEAKAEVE